MTIWLVELWLVELEEFFDFPHDELLPELPLDPPPCPGEAGEIPVWVALGALASVVVVEDEVPVSDVPVEELLGSA